MFQMCLNSILMFFMVFKPWYIQCFKPKLMFQNALMLLHKMILMFLINLMFFNVFNNLNTICLKFLVRFLQNLMFFQHFLPLQAFSTPQHYFPNWVSHIIQFLRHSSPPWIWINFKIHCNNFCIQFRNRKLLSWIKIISFFSSTFLKISSYVNHEATSRSLWFKVQNSELKVDYGNCRRISFRYEGGKERKHLKKAAYEKFETWCVC